MAAVARALQVALAVLLLAVLPPQAALPASITVCFTPGQDCTGLIVEALTGARQTVYVQAYQFTSVPILSALKAAHARGVDVQVILDRASARVSKSGSRYSAAVYLSNAGIPIWVDTRVSIAHNKVLVIDGRTVLTGSFNFTAAAQNRNAENLIVIEDSALAQQYLANWERRRAVSLEYTQPLAQSTDEEE